MNRARNFLLVIMVATSGLISSAQTVQTLFFFNYTNGESPQAALTLGNDGNFYGTTCYGGSFGFGTVFSMASNGTLTTLVSFTSTNGSYPVTGLTLGNDGNFYGTTASGGSYYASYGGYGTVFKMTTNGTLTTLVSFNYTNGYYPQGALTQVVTAISMARLELEPMVMEPFSK